MGRRRHRYRGTRDYRDEILLAEFKFYNKTKKVISEDVLKEMEERLATKKEQKIYWTNATFAKHKIGFSFERVGKTDDKYDIYISILEFSIPFTADAFNKTKYIFEKKLFIGFDLTHAQCELIDDMLYDYYNLLEKEVEKITSPIMSWDELVNNMLLRYNLRYGDDNDWETFVDDIKMMFGDEAFFDYPKKDGKIEKPKYNMSSQGSYGATKVFHILSIIERRINNRNYRIALCTNLGHYYNQYTIKIFSDQGHDYTNIDQGRLFFVADNSHNYYLDDGIKEYSDGLIINMDIISQMRRNIEQLVPRGEYIITPNIYRFYKDRVVKFESEKDYMGGSAHEQQIIEQYKKILEKGKTISMYNAIINKKKIEVDSEMFKIEFNDDFLDVVGNIGNIRKLLRSNDVKYNFNLLYEKILQLSILKYVRMEFTKERQYRNFEGIEFKVNGMDIEVHKDKNRMKINGVFTRINDVYHILTKIICYNDVKEFEKYVQEVSHIGIEWKQMISNGVALELNNPFRGVFNKTGIGDDDRMRLRFSLLWNPDKRTEVFLLLNNEKYLIKYKGKFKYYFNLPHRVITMSQLKKELNECLEEINDDIIIEIVENAIEEGKIIKQRGEQLVKDTIKEINANETEIDLHGGKVKGFLFTGIRTGNNYFVEKIGLSVYRKDKGGAWNRRCIVSDHNKQRIYEDKLANRLINVYNEPEYLIRYLT